MAVTRSSFEEILEKVTFNKLAPDFTDNISQFVHKV